MLALDARDCKLFAGFSSVSSAFDATGACRALGRLRASASGSLAMTELRAAPGTSSDGRNAGSDAEFHRRLLEDMLFARTAVRAALEPAAPGPPHHRGPARGPGGRGRRGRAGARPRPRLVGALLPRRHRHTAALGDEFLEQLVDVLAGPPRRRAHPRRRALPAAADLARYAGAARSRDRLGPRRCGAIPGVVCTFIGDGATSEGDFYEA